MAVVDGLGQAGVGGCGGPGDGPGTPEPGLPDRWQLRFARDGAPTADSGEERQLEARGELRAGHGLDSCVLLTEIPRTDGLLP